MIWFLRREILLVKVIVKKKLAIGYHSMSHCNERIIFQFNNISMLYTKNVFEKGQSEELYY